MDRILRSLERAYHLERTATALTRLNHARVRAGLPEIDLNPLLSYAQELQDGFDDVWWHRRGPGPFIFGLGQRRYEKDYDPKAKKLVKAHKIRHTFRRGKNAKKKTLRTHRTGRRRR